jgi:multidrug efflux system outer membrane protein
VSTGAVRQAGITTTGSAVPATLVTAGLNLSYERTCSAGCPGQRSRTAGRPGARRLLQSTRLMVQADVAQTYLQLRAVQAEHGWSSSLAAYRDTLT